MRRAILLLALVTGLAGCGSSSSTSHSSSKAAKTSRGRRPRSTARAPPKAVPGARSRGNARGATASAAEVSVIKGWSDALRRGDVRTAASYFHLPSEMVNGVGSGGGLTVIRIRNLKQAEFANETLPCGARFVSASRHGKFVNALFKLTGRSGPGGSSCNPGAGENARTDFLISHGQIVQWIRAPNEPGDNTGPAAGGRSV